VPSPSGVGGGPRMHDSAIRAGSAGGQTVQVVPGLLGVQTPVTTGDGGGSSTSLFGVGFCFCTAVGVALGVWGVVVPPLG
jgi:hypothetical protein